MKITLYNNRNKPFELIHQNVFLIIQNLEFSSVEKFFNRLKTFWSTIRILIIEVLALCT